MITNKINCLFEFGNANVYNDLGGSPELLTDLCQWFQKQKQNIFSIDIALYLFNNEYLFSILKDLADHGCRVHIYSIPLEGYDNTSPLEITNHISNVPIGRYTKLDLAKKIYETIKDLKHPNLTLHIVPHMYIRSKYVKPFSRGDMPYSLHCKTFMIQFHNGNFYGGLTSSNFAVRDAQKIELACIMPLGKNEIASSTDFYYGLRENSIPISDFDPNADYTHYTIKLRNVPENSQTTYIAPFYDHSAVQFENKLIQLIRQAKHRIIIAAQHISSYQYTYLGKYSSHDSTDSLVMKEGFLSYVLQKVREGVPAVFLSQTYADQTDRPYIRKPQNTKSFIQFAETAKKTEHCHYYVNRNLHAKYLLIDNTAIVTTCNFTPTQFIYLSNVKISSFEHIPNLTYSGIFCEHGAYFTSQNPETIKRLEHYTDKIISLRSTEKIFGK